MTYVITEPCIGDKDNSCVEVCPVDCIHPTPKEADYDAHEQLYIDPDECIDCDACVEACPVDAIYAQEHGPAGVAAVHGDQRRLLPRAGGLRNTLPPPKPRPCFAGLAGAVLRFSPPSRLH